MSIQFYRQALGEVRKIVKEQNVEIRGIFGKQEDGRGYTMIEE
jgi:hypothetical protein